MAPFGYPEGAFLILTMTDTTMLELQRALGRLEAKVDGLRAQQEQIDGLIARVASLERWRSYLAGAVVALGALWVNAIKLLPLLR